MLYRSIWRNWQKKPCIILEFLVVQLFLVFWHVQFKNRLCRCVQAHPSQPGGARNAEFIRIHQFHPIPSLSSCHAQNNMKLNNFNPFISNGRVLCFFVAPSPQQSGFCMMWTFHLMSIRLDVWNITSTSSIDSCNLHRWWFYSFIFYLELNQMFFQSS